MLKAASATRRCLHLDQGIVASYKKCWITSPAKAVQKDPKPATPSWTLACCLIWKHNLGMCSAQVFSRPARLQLLLPGEGADLCTHVVLSEFIDSDLGLHEVVVEDDDFSAEGSLLLLVVVGLRRQEQEERRRERQKVKYKCKDWQIYNFLPFFLAIFRQNLNIAIIQKC